MKNEKYRSATIKWVQSPQYQAMDLSERELAALIAELDELVGQVSNADSDWSGLAKDWEFDIPDSMIDPMNDQASWDLAHAVILAAQESSRGQ